MNLVLSILKWILVCTKKHVSAESTYLKRKVVNARKKKNCEIKKKEELWMPEKMSFSIGCYYYRINKCKDSMSNQ